MALQSVFTLSSGRCFWCPEILRGAVFQCSLCTRPPQGSWMPFNQLLSTVLPAQRTYLSSSRTQPPFHPLTGFSTMKSLWAWTTTQCQTWILSSVPYQRCRVSYWALIRKLSLQYLPHVGPGDRPVYHHLTACPLCLMLLAKGFYY